MIKNDNIRLEVWKRECLERDDYKCMVFGSLASVVHHIIPRKYLEFRWRIDNGLSVSVYGHTWISNRNTTTMQFVRAVIGEHKFKKLREAFFDEYGWDYFKRWSSDSIS